jgi:signal transduction histidine kinase
VNQPTWWEHVRRVNPLVWDGLLAAVVLSITAASVAGDNGADGAIAWVLIGLLCVPLAFRRRAPLIVLGIVSGASVAFAIGGDGASPELALALAIYTVAAHRPWRRVATVGLPAGLAAGLASQIAMQRHGNWIEVLIGLTFAVGLPALLGRIAYNRRRRLARDRDLAAREAVARERTRIARELHDVVAHAIGVMVVQAGAARTVLDRDPRAAKTAIGQVEDAGRAGLAEMRRLIGVLTDEDAAASTAPQPGLAQLDSLIETVRAAGLPVEVVRSGTPRELSAGADLASYRVIQESLTNALKHAGPAHARVGLDYAPDRLVMEVADDGDGLAAEPGIGHGLVGMRERVGLFGGTLETAERPGGGFVVRAEIPIEEPL